MAHDDASFVVFLLTLFLVSTFGPTLIVVTLFGVFMGFASLFRYRPSNYSGLAKSLLLSLVIQAGFTPFVFITSLLWKSELGTYFPTIAMVLSWLVGSAIFIYCLVWRYGLTKENSQGG